MSEFKLHILGCGSATPSLRHLPSCQVVEYRGQLLMIDCGEGAQLSMRRMGLKFSRLTQTVLDLPGLTVESFPLRHRVPAVGFIFREKPKPLHLRGDMVKFHNVPVSQMKAIKEGADFINEDGKTIPNAMLTTPADRSYTYAYCSDTVYTPALAKIVEEADLLYHEATYADDAADKARARGHSTASEAARIASLAHVRRLVIGHYSKAYNTEERHLSEARRIFPDTMAANEGMTIPIDCRHQL